MKLSFAIAFVTALYIASAEYKEQPAPGVTGGHGGSLFRSFIRAVPSMTVVFLVLMILKNLSPAVPLTLMIRIPFALHTAVLVRELLFGRDNRAAVWRMTAFTLDAFVLLLILSWLLTREVVKFPYLWAEFCLLSFGVFFSWAFRGDEAGQRVSKVSAVLTALLMPYYMFVIVELASNGQIQSLVPEQYKANFLLFYLADVILFSLFGILSFALLGGLAFFAGMANHFVMVFRHQPILPVDLLAVDTAASVAKEYEYKMVAPLAISLITAILLIVLTIGYLYAFRRTGKDRGEERLTAGETVRTWIRNAVKGWKVRILRIAAAAAAAGVLFHVVRDGNFEKTFGIEPVLWAPTLTYEAAGTMAGFVTLYQTALVRKPEGYSAANVREIFSEAGVLDGGASGGKTDGKPGDPAVKPHVIIVMDESFADLSALGPIDCVEQDLSCLKSLKDDPLTLEYGWNHVSTRGGETARSEFECITGFSLAYMPGSMPYLEYEFDQVPAMAANLASQGYRSLAMHPYSPKNWRRNTVYPKMGFERFLSQKDFKGAPVLHWDRISDEGTYLKIEELLTSKEYGDDPLFIFDVTLQNHSPYIPDGFNEIGYPLVEIDERYKNQTDVQCYETLMDNSDKAFGDFIEYIRAFDEPVIVCFFGDHQASLDPNWETMMIEAGRTPEDNEISIQEKYYTVPYVIWANYPVDKIPAFQGGMTSTNYLGAVLQLYAGAKLTPFDRYLLNLRTALPVVNSVGYMGSDGHWYGLEEKSPYENLIREYRKVQYNGMFERESNKDLFRLEGGAE